MTGRTHDLAAFTALNIVLVTQPIPDVSLSTALVSVGICLIGGLTPDIDDSTSEFWHKLPAGTIIGRLLHPFIGGHRLISHSILGLVIVGWISSNLLNLASTTLIVNMTIVWWSFMIGYLSHLIMDSLTTEGVPWLFPIPVRLGFLPFKSLRFKTGGLIEKFFIFPGLLILNCYLFYNYYQIYINFITKLIK
ncbi:MAG: metal-dependent hydrolase [Candidatus Daviesbacteria bacterium]